MNRIVGTLNGSSQELDPATIMVSSQWHILTNLGINLVTYDANSKFVGQAASSWKINSEATEFEFVLNEGLKDSNGKILDSSDWKATFEHLLRKKGSTHSFVDEYLAEDGILTPSPHVLKLVLKKPYRTLLQRLTTPEFILLPRSAIDRNNEVNLKISSGPYFIKSLDHKNDVTVLSANHHYFEYSPLQPEEVEIQAGTSTAQESLENIKSGKWNFMILLTPPTDKASATVEDAVKNKHIRISEAELSGVAFILLRESNHLKTLKERLAFSDFVHKAASELKNSTSKVANQIYPPGFTGALPAPDEAKIWSQIEADARGTHLPNSLIGFASNGVHSYNVPAWLLEKLAAKVQSTHIEKLAHDEYIKIHNSTKHDFTIIMTGMNSKDPAGSLLTLLGPKSGVIPDVKGDLAHGLELASQSEGSARAKHLQWVSEELLKRGLVIPLFHYASAIATSYDLQASQPGKYNYDLLFHRVRWTTKK